MSQVRDKHVTLLLFLVFGLVQGFGDHLVSQGSDASRVYSLSCLVVNLVFIMRWFVLDAREHNFRISKALFITFAAVTFVAAPYYFIKTRGSKGLISILWAALFSLMLGMSVVAGEWIAELSNVKAIL